jgi:hypothetical protein
MLQFGKHERVIEMSIAPTRDPLLARQCIASAKKLDCEARRLRFRNQPLDEPKVVAEMSQGICNYRNPVFTR